jgi:hypothetical protein
MQLLLVYLLATSQATHHQLRFQEFHHWQTLYDSVRKLSMKRIISFIPALVLAAALISNVRADESVFKPLAEAPKAEGEEFFKVTEGEAKVDGHVIKLFVIKPEYLTASYKNESKKALFPKFTVRTYNRYGYLLGSDKVGESLFGGSPQLEAGDVGGEKITLDIVDIAGVFKHTLLKLPSDFFDVAWVSLADANTKLGE